MSSYSQRQQETAAQLDARTMAFLEDLESLDESQLTFHPDAESWSARDVAHHLMLIEKNILIGLKKPQKLWQPNLKNRALHLAVKAVLRWGIKVKAPSKAVYPTDAIELADLKSQWLEARAGIKEILFASAEGEPKVKHPIAGPLDSLEGFKFILMHLNHHMKQVARLRANESFPSSPDQTTRA